MIAICSGCRARRRIQSCQLSVSRPDDIASFSWVFTGTPPFKTLKPLTHDRGLHAVPRLRIYLSKCSLCSLRFCLLCHLECQCIMSLHESASLYRCTIYDINNCCVDTFSCFIVIRMSFVNPEYEKSLYIVEKIGCPLKNSFGSL